MYPNPKPRSMYREVIGLHPNDQSVESSIQLIFSDEAVWASRIEKNMLSSLWINSVCFFFLFNAFRYNRRHSYGITNYLFALLMSKHCMGRMSPAHACNKKKDWKIGWTGTARFGRNVICSRVGGRFIEILYMPSVIKKTKLIGGWGGFEYMRAKGFLCIQYI